MSGRSHRPSRPDRLAQWFAFKHLCDLVCRDPNFIRDRGSILRAHDWLQGHDEEILSAWYQLLRDVPGDTALREVMNGVGRLTTRYGFDRLRDGHHFMFLMTILGKPPRRLDRHQPYVWNLQIAMRPDESLMDAFGQTRVDLNEIWEKIQVAPKADVWAELTWVSELLQRVTWYFRVRIKGITITSLATAEGPSESTISRGVRQVQRLLEIPVRRGRPPRKIVKHRPKKTTDS